MSGCTSRLDSIWTNWRGEELESRSFFEGRGTIGKVDNKQYIPAPPHFSFLFILQHHISCPTLQYFFIGAAECDDVQNVPEDGEE